MPWKVPFLNRARSWNVAAENPASPWKVAPSKKAMPWKPSDAACSACPAGSRARPAGACCTCHVTGHGPGSSWSPWLASERFPCAPDLISSQPCNARTAGRPRGRLLQPPTDTPTRAAGALHGPRRTASTHAAASPLTKERPKAARPRASTRPAVDPGLAHCCRGGPWSSGGVPFCRACSACWSSRDDDAAAAVEAVRRRLQEERGHIGA
jgi:hypothetical protein